MGLSTPSGFLKNHSQIPKFIYRYKFVFLTGLLLALIFRLGKPSQAKRICDNEFYVYPSNNKTENLQNQWPCYPRTPNGFSPPLEPEKSLWQTPRANIGKLNEESTAYKLYIKSQMWAKLDQQYVKIEEHGGTAGRAFRNNFHYVQTLNDSLDLNIRCGQTPTMLDMGGGIASVAAAFRDQKGLNDSVKILTYTQPDDFLRLQSIISDRGLPSFIFDFKTTTPFPDESFDFVHCKWCWHWLGGYEVWLKEVDRILLPGGHFIFTLSKGNDGILVEDKWDRQIQKFNFECRKYNRIINLCKKKGDLENSCVKDGSSGVSEFRPVITHAMKELKMDRPRLLNLHCPDASLCTELEPYFRMTLHVSEDVDQVKQLNMRRRLAMVHDFSINLPTYPRTYDVVNIGCSSHSERIFNKPCYWTDLHRVIRPGGAVMVLKKFCKENLESMLVKAMFKLQYVSDDILLAWRMEVLER